MKIAALVKQVATPTGLAMDALSRRAVAQGVELAAAVGDGTCTAITLGPPDAEDVLREAIAWGRTCNAITDGVLVTPEPTSPATALAAAQLLTPTLAAAEPFDLVLLGARAEDDGTGLLGPHLAELLDRPFAASARHLGVQGRTLHLRCEHEHDWVQISVPIPAVVSCAAELIHPGEATPTARELVPADLISTSTAHLEVAAAEVGTQSGAPTAVVSPLGTAMTGGSVPDDAVHLSVEGSDVEEDIAHAVGAWAMRERPGRVVLPDSMWGREIAGRIAVRLADTAVDVETTDLTSDHRAGPVTTISATRTSRVRVVARTPRGATER